MAVGTQQRSSSHFQKAVEIVRSGKLGKIFWVQTWNYENISPVGMGKIPDTAAPSSVDYERWLGPAPVRPFNPTRFHLLFRWYFDYAGGMMSDWGVHLNDIVVWALGSNGPKSVYTSGGIFTTDDDRDTPDTMQVVYEFPECTLTYSMRKGNGLKFNDHEYGILFCGTDGSLLLDREGFEVIPDKVELPYGIKLALGDRSIRKIDLSGSSSQRCRRPGRTRAQLPRLREVAGAADLRYRDCPSVDEYVPSRQYLVQAGPKARMGRGDRALQERPGRRRAPFARAAEGIRASAGLSIPGAEGLDQLPTPLAFSLRRVREQLPRCDPESYEQNDRAHHTNDRHAHRDGGSVGRLSSEQQQDTLGNLAARRWSRASRVVRGARGTDRLAGRRIRRVFQ